MTNKIKIVAEIGCNHNGDVQIAKKLIVEAKRCGADAVKFQTFNSHELISKNAPKADYQKITTGDSDSQLEMTKKLELSHSDYLLLKDYAEQIGIECYSTPFDIESIDFLESIGQMIWKIPSGEITNLPYLEKIGSIKIKNKQIILSTGMSTIDEIEIAIEILKKNGSTDEEITILHCNTEYPTPDEDVNILAINDIKKHFSKNKVGFSDHSIGYIASIIAAGQGITMIEKHFTLNKDFPGPDHKASITPIEFEQLCKKIRMAEKMLGDGKKIITQSEKKNKLIARKSIIAKKDIKKGDLLTVENITCKRPGNGISPMYWYDVLNTIAENDFKCDELILINGIEYQQ